MRSFFVICLLSGSLLLTGCSTQTGNPSSDSDRDSILVPDSELHGARIHLYDRGLVTTEIRATKIVRFEAIDSAMAYVLDVDALDSTGRVTGHIVADSGVIREKAGFLDLYGDVVLITEDTTKLETDYLNYSSNTDRLRTDAFVTITKGNDIVTGWGLEADQKLETYKILRDVQGTITDTKQLSEP